MERLKCFGHTFATDAITINAYDAHLRISREVKRCKSVIMTIEGGQVATLRKVDLLQLIVGTEETS